MKVVLTFDHDEYGKAESTQDLPDDDARRLLREGNARSAEGAVSTRKKAPVKQTAAKQTETSPAAGETKED